MGVEYIRNGRKETVGVTREVILAAGPISSSQILVMSGIGPEKQLHDLKVHIFRHYRNAFSILSTEYECLYVVFIIYLL